jgi:hypothetical protein
MEHTDAVGKELWRGSVPIEFLLAIEDRAISSDFSRIDLSNRSDLYSLEKK